MWQNQVFGLVLDAYVSCLPALLKGLALGGYLLIYSFCFEFSVWGAIKVAKSLQFYVFKHFVCHFTTRASVSGCIIPLEFDMSKVQVSNVIAIANRLCLCSSSYNLGSEYWDSDNVITETVLRSSENLSWQKRTFWEWVDWYFQLQILQFQRQESFSQENHPWP